MDNLVKVEGGVYIRRDDFDVRSDAIVPEITVKVDTFYINDFVVTQYDWNKVMEFNPSYFKDDALPVECVGWHDAVLFCNRKSEREGIESCYTIKGKQVKCDFTAGGYRLPAEVEWEFAAKGGVKSKGFRYAGSDSLEEAAWYGENSERTTHPRGQKIANELGLYDMCGNVFEWCWDWFDKLEGDYMDNPRGPAKGKMKVARGNCWINGVTTSALNRRVHRDVECRNHHLGFRIVRTKLQDNE